MSKLIKVLFEKGQLVSVKVPNILIYSFSKNLKKESAFIELFYYFAQKLDPKPNKASSVEDKEGAFDRKKRTLIELNDRVEALKFFSKAVARQEKLLRLKKIKKRKIYDYRPHQIYLAVVGSFLDSCHAIVDALEQIDKSLDKDFSSDIYSKDWYRLDVDIRNVLHHNETPLLEEGTNGIIFTFTRLPRGPKYLNEQMKDSNGRYHVLLDSKEAGREMLAYLNLWAKRYLDLIPIDEGIDVITGFHADGRIKTKTILLNDFLKRYE